MRKLENFLGRIFLRSEKFSRRVLQKTERFSIQLVGNSVYEGDELVF
jgi:hypothetical protein